MVDASYRQLYLDWIEGIVYDDEHGDEYSDLLETLYQIPFRYTIPQDANRLSDGHDLRLRFGYEKLLDYSEVEEALDFPVSLLEVLVALALRGEEAVMRDFDIGDRTALWFWMMMDNMHLTGQTNYNFDPNYVVDCADTMMDRKYSYNGDGGIVYLENPPTDLRQAELWYQLCWYFSSLV